jgi:hypothetical protein
LELGHQALDELLAEEHHVPEILRLGAGDFEPEIPQVIAQQGVERAGLFVSQDQLHRILLPAIAMAWSAGSAHSRHFVRVSGSGRMWTLLRRVQADGGGSNPDGESKSHANDG